MSNQNRLSAGRRNMLDQLVHAHMPRYGSMVYFQYIELISVVRSNSSILTPRAVGQQHGDRSVNRMVHAMARMASCWQNWIKPIYTWTPDRNASAYAQFQSLANHLFAKYEVPNFMTNCWFEGGQAVRLYVALGRGRSVRKCRMPITFNKPTAKHFMNAPNDLNVIKAVRWAQVRSYGGSATLARAILATRLAKPQRDEAFWETFLRFLANNELGQIESKVKTTVTEEELIKMVEFCNDQKFRRASQVLGYNVLLDQPLQPNFSVKDRSVRWLRQRMANWQTEVELPERTALRFNQTRFAFPPSCIGHFRFVDGPLSWTIDQITNSDLLHVEGGMMRHCVASYASRCRVGATSIWSLKVNTVERKRRMVTIEVWPSTKVIVQVKGKANSIPSDVAVTMIKKWAKQEGLTWPGYEEEKAE